MRARRHRWRIGTSCCGSSTTTRRGCSATSPRSASSCSRSFPTLSGAVVALVSASSSGVELLAIGGLGLAATLGRARVRAAQRGAAPPRHRPRRTASRRSSSRAARWSARGSGRTPRLFGLIPASHRLGVGLVYGAALGGWVYLVVWGALAAAGARAHSQAIGVAVGVVVALAIVREVVVAQRPDARPATTASAPSR